VHQEGERAPRLHEDLVTRLRAACDSTSDQVDVDKHADLVAREVARAREARAKLVSGRKTT